MPVAIFPVLQASQEHGLAWISLWNLAWREACLVRGVDVGEGHVGLTGDDADVLGNVLRP
jgi:hypothetical protein